MRKIIPIIIFITLATFTPPKVEAIVVECVNCSQFANQILQYALQGLQLGKETVTSGASVITATQQTLSTVKQTITDPLRNALTLSAILSSSNQIRNLILGTTGGNSLLITNPEQYIKNQGLNSVNLNLGTVASQNGPYSDSIFSSVVSLFKNDDVTSKLAKLNQSSIPSITQQEKCTDAALTAQAKKDVIRSDNTYNQTELQARKQEIYNILCTCNPKTDQKCAQTLTSVNNQSPSLNSFYAITQGENQYTKVTLGTSIIAEEKQRVQEAKKADLVAGGGIASKTACTKYGVDVNGNPLCAEETITNLSSQLKSSYEEAVNTPTRTLIASFGTGAYGLFSDIIGIMGSVQNITGAFDSLDGDSGTPINSTALITRNDPIAQDPAQRAQLVSPIQQQMSTQLNDLDSLLSLDGKYLSEIIAYGTRLDSIRACYDKLVLDYPELQSQSAPAYSFYNTKNNANNNLYANINSEINSIPGLKTDINSFLSTIETSTNSQDILDLFTSYQNKSDTIGLETSLVREDEYRNFLEMVRQDTSTSGNITAYMGQCAYLRAQQQQYNNYNEGE